MLWELNYISHREKSWRKITLSLLLRIFICLFFGEKYLWEWELLVFILLARFCKRMVLSMWGCVGIIYKPASCPVGLKMQSKSEVGTWSSGAPVCWHSWGLLFYLGYFLLKKKHTILYEINRVYHIIWTNPWFVTMNNMFCGDLSLKIAVLFLG